MSVSILLIALLPTIPIFMVLSVSNNRVYITLTSIVMGFIGALSGKPAYMIIDIIFIVIAWFVCFMAAVPTYKKPGENIKKSNRLREYLWNFCLVMAFVSFLWPTYEQYSGSKEKPVKLVAPTVAPKVAQAIKKPLVSTR